MKTLLRIAIAGAVAGAVAKALRMRSGKQAGGESRLRESQGTLSGMGRETSVGNAGMESGGGWDQPHYQRGVAEDAVPTLRSVQEGSLESASTPPHEPRESREQGTQMPPQPGERTH